MNPPLDRTLWVLAAGIAVAFFLLAGYFGWATIFVWSIPALLLGRRAVKSPKSAPSEWPTPRLRVTWLVAMLLSALAGIAQLLPSDLDTPLGPALATLVGGLYLLVAWGGLVLTACVVGVATYAAVWRRGGSAV